MVNFQEFCEVIIYFYRVKTGKNILLIVYGYVSLWGRMTLEDSYKPQFGTKFGRFQRPKNARLKETQIKI